MRPSRTRLLKTKWKLETVKNSPHIFKEPDYNAETGKEHRLIRKAKKRFKEMFDAIPSFFKLRKQLSGVFEWNSIDTTEKTVLEW